MNVKKLLPYLAAIVIFLIVTFIQVRPVFSGKEIDQYDMFQYRGMSKEIIDHRNTYNEDPVWVSTMFSGMPAYQISVEYAGNLLPYLQKFIHLFMPRLAGTVFMYFLGFYILMLSLRVNPWIAIAGSLAYGLSSYFFIILEVGHITKALAISYAAPALAGVILTMRGKFYLGFTVTLVFMALELFSNHPQITYYTILIAALIVFAYLIRAIKEKALKKFITGVLLLIAASAIAFLPNGANLLNTFKYAKYTIRGNSELTIDASLKSNTSNKTSGLDKDYATQWSYGIDETFTLLIPNYKGGASTTIQKVNKDALRDVDPQLRDSIANANSYFGTQTYTAGPVYIGAIIVLLAFMGVFIVNHTIKWPLIIVTLLSFMLAWGHNFMWLSSLFLDHFPLYNKFRAVSMILFIAELALPILAILALDKLCRVVEGKNEKIKLQLLNKTYDVKKLFYISVAVVGGFCLVSYLFPSIFNTFTSPQEEIRIGRQLVQSGATDAQIANFLPEYMKNLKNARIAIFKSDTLRSLIFILLSSGLILLYLKRTIKLPWLITGIILLVGADMWGVAARYLNKGHFVPIRKLESPPPQTTADASILADKALNFRVLDLTTSPFQDAKASYYHKSLGGYHGAKLKKYQEIIEFHLSKEIDMFYSGINSALRSDSLFREFASELSVINMLNTRYFILPTGDQPTAIQNPQANGNVWFVKELITVANADSEIVKLYDIDTKTQAVIQEKNKSSIKTTGPTYSSLGTITLVSFKANHLVYESDSPDNQFAVFSEVYYPEGWNAYIDGQLTPHTAVNYILRGMELPKGKHKVEFKFEPESVKIGNAISLSGSILFAVLTILGLYFAVRKHELVLNNG